MIYIKLFEDYGETPITISLGEYIKIKSFKSKKFEPEYIKTYNETEEFGYFTKSRDIEILICDNLTGSLNIDERHFNTLIRYNWLPIKNDKFIDKLNKLIVKYLLDCHDRMKQSNPDYGYGRREGKLPLLTHHFFDYVEQDFQTSDSKLVKKIKKIEKDIPFYLDANKYNL